MDKTTKTQNTAIYNKENLIDANILKERTVHHDFTVKTMEIGSDFTVLEHTTVKKYNNNNNS